MVELKRKRVKLIEEIKTYQHAHLHAAEKVSNCKEQKALEDYGIDGHLSSLSKQLNKLKKSISEH